MNSTYSTLLFELSKEGKQGCFYPDNSATKEPVDKVLPKALLRGSKTNLPSVSEPEIVRHFTLLSHKNFSIDTHFYPLGSCTMKYNPRITEAIASFTEFNALHPLQPQDSVQGILKILHEMQSMLAEITGMHQFSLEPAAGAHGEFTGLKIIMAFHKKRGDLKRKKVIVPDSSHGTNPATAALCGCEVVVIKSNASGLVDVAALKAVLGDDVACLMLTNPNTLGLFERDIMKIAKLVHDAGGFLYYDGANMNALLDIARPGDMGFDVVHLNLHKTFATPHGGGGPGSGPVGVVKALATFLPEPIIEKTGQGTYVLQHNILDSIGKVKAFYGNINVIIKAYCYIRLLGIAGLRQVSEDAILAANYVKKKLDKVFKVPYSATCMHEFVLTTEKEGKDDIHSADVGKRLLDFGFHAPTVSFPLIVKNALMIEPTESESKETLDAFIDAMIKIAGEIEKNPEIVKHAPYTMPVKRCDEVKAARTPNLKYQF
jgi:glycine dehydrogenase subunit 2